MEEEETVVNEQPKSHSTALPEAPLIPEINKEDPDQNTDSILLKEIAMNSIDYNTIATCSTPSNIICGLDDESKALVAGSRMPMVVISTSPGTSNVITKQPRSAAKLLQSSPPSPLSRISTLTMESNQPQSLFFQALSKMNENPLSLRKLNDVMKMIEKEEERKRAVTTVQSLELSPPNSLTSAPPSYSFVLRQTARRRPRLMGTFIPSPSFVQHTPPPNYAAAFDIYVDNTVPHEATRIYSFGFVSTPVVCPECGYTGLTAVTSKITLCTHFCAFLLCLFCCWLCAPLPYIMRSCKDVYHYCRNCRILLGIYSPSNPETPCR